MMSTIPLSELQAGDVLLYNSHNLVSRLIQSFDNSEVSHAGLCLGNGNVGESLIVGNPGVNINPIETSIAGCEWVEASRLHRQLDSQPILHIADSYLAQGNRYAYGQILLLAAICLTRKLDQSNWLVRQIAERTLRGAASIVGMWRSENREPMICSEFVYRTYDQALPEPDDPYSLEILSQTSGRPTRRFSIFRRNRGVFGAGAPPESPVVHPDSLLAHIQEEPTQLDQPRMMAAAPQTEDEVEREISQLAEQYFGEGPMFVGATGEGSNEEEVDELDVESAAVEFARSLADAAASTDVDGKQITYVSAAGDESTKIDQLMGVVADFVTPGDLHQSPSLNTVGRLEQ